MIILVFLITFFDNANACKCGQAFMVPPYVHNKSKFLPSTTGTKGIKYLLCQRLTTMNQDPPLNKEGIKID